MSLIDITECPKREPLCRSSMHCLAASGASMTPASACLCVSAIVPFVTMCRKAMPSSGLCSRQRHMPGLSSPYSLRDALRDLKIAGCNGVISS